MQMWRRLTMAVPIACNMARGRTRPPCFRQVWHDEAVALDPDRAHVPPKDLLRLLVEVDAEGICVRLIRIVHDRDRRAPVHLYLHSYPDHDPLLRYASRRRVVASLAHLSIVKAVS